MESDDYLLSHQLQIQIQGLVGEIVALDYVRRNLKIDPLDEVIITTNRCNKQQSTQSASQNPNVAYFYTVNKSPFEFLSHELVDYYLRIGCEGIDLTNADLDAKNLFEEYISKTKEQILFELEQLYSDYKKEREMEKEEIEKLKESRKLENIGKSESYELTSEKIKTLSHKDLAKILTLIELERRTKKKLMVESDTSIKIRSLITFSNLLFYPLNMERVGIDYNRRKMLKTISKYANAKYEELNILSAIFKSIVQTKTIIDSMIVQYSSSRILKKLIIIECKTGDAVLSDNQKAFVDCIKQMKSDRVEYKIINVNYQAPKQLSINIH